jgi:hypothetical protein
MINIITSFYFSNINHPNIEERNTELQTCLNNNLNNPLIEKIHLYVDDDKALNYLNSLNNQKINIIAVKKPLYSDLFKYAFDNLKNKICMVTNSDIYMHEADINVLNILNQDNIVFSLTRYEHDMGSPLIDKYQGSHDCFLFKSPLNYSLIENIQHAQHHWNSEGIVLYELNRINAKIFNPCRQIKIVHLHKSDIREENRIRICPGKYILVTPCIFNL